MADTARRTCDVLGIDDFDRLSPRHPAIKLKLWRRLCFDVGGTLRRANRELSVLD